MAADGAPEVFEAELWIPCGNKLGECPRWDEARGFVCWLDIEGCRFWRCHPDEAAAAESFELPARASSFCTTESGEYVFAFEDGFSFYDPETGTRLRISDDFEPGLRTRMNDGRVDRQGRYVVGGHVEKGSEPKTAVYRLNADLRVERLLEGVRTANSICFTEEPLDNFLRSHLFAPLGVADTGFAAPPADRHRLAALYARGSAGGPLRCICDGAPWVVGSESPIHAGGGVEDDSGAMFFTDTMRDSPEIVRYPDYASSGMEGPAEVFVPSESFKGRPDGSTIDSEGCLWNAEFGGGRVVRYRQDGSVSAVVHVSVRYTTCCAFGGPDLRTLFITEASPSRLSKKKLEAYPPGCPGGLFRVRLPVAGLPEVRFRGSSASLAASESAGAAAAPAAAEAPPPCGRGSDGGL